MATTQFTCFFFVLIRLKNQILLERILAYNFRNKEETNQTNNHNQGEKTTRLNNKLTSSSNEVKSKSQTNRI